MVSSAPTQVAQIPSMHEDTKSGRGLSNPYPPEASEISLGVRELGDASSVKDNFNPAIGLATVTETSSAPSTGESSVTSATYAGESISAIGIDQGFVDAPQEIEVIDNADPSNNRPPQGLSRQEMTPPTDFRAISPAEGQQPYGAPRLSIPHDYQSGNSKESSKLHYKTPKRSAAAAAAEFADEVLVGTRVSEGHESFVTAYNMLTGIRVAVSRCTAKNNRSLTEADYIATDEINFDLSGGGHSHSSKYIFQFKDYSPWVFRHLRDFFRLDPADYLMSLTAKYIVSELGSPGKSGSFFYYSRDYRFIIKTIRHSEHKLLRRILKSYTAHVKNNPNTLISQFYGLHRVRLPFGRKIHFVVMNNVFPALYEIHERYDLKGSLLGREYRPDASKPIIVYKDLDWLRNHKRIVLGCEKRELLVKQLELDTKFLQHINVMDYSLLIGIHDMQKGNAALNSLLKLEEFGPKSGTKLDKRDAVALSNDINLPKSGSGMLNNKGKKGSAQKDFADLQTLLKKATPEKLKEFDFADEYRSEFLFYRDHGGFQSTNDQNETLDVIYYVGVIDFLTEYTFKKSVETFCKSLIHDRRDLSAVPANEYGDRFLRFLRGCIGPAIPSSKPQKRLTNDSRVVAQKVDNKFIVTPSELSSNNDPQEASKLASGRADLSSSGLSSTPTLTLAPPNIPSYSAQSSVNAISTPNSRIVIKTKSHSSNTDMRRPSVAGYGQGTIGESLILA